MAALAAGRLDAVLPTLGVMAMAGFRLAAQCSDDSTTASIWSRPIASLWMSWPRSWTFHHHPYPVPIPKKDSRTDSAPVDQGPVVSQSRSNFATSPLIILGWSARRCRAINLRIKRGTSIGFVGQTGSGKSTLINILLGLYEPTAGRNSRRRQTLPQACAATNGRLRIGYVPQEIFLLDDNLVRNIALGSAG